MVMKYSKCPQNIPNGPKICMSINIVQSKFCPKWDFWFEKPSGSPVKATRKNSAKGYAKQT
jgi:hypothetical protein